MPGMIKYRRSTNGWFENGESAEEQAFQPK
jgi:hypothetical protein